MRALGIDPGLVRTGWAIVEPVGSGSVVLAHGVIAPPTSAELPARLADGARQLRQVLATYQPDLVALEEVFTAPRHPRSALLMAHMRGAICLVLEEAGVPILALTATTVKQRLTSSGHASKEQVQRMVLPSDGPRAHRAHAPGRNRRHRPGAGRPAQSSGQWSVVSGQCAPELARGKAALRRHINDLGKRSPPDRPDH